MGGGRKGRGRGNSRAMTREFPSLACLPRARLFFLAPITSKLLLRRPREFPPSAMLFSSLLLLVSIFTGMYQSSWKKGSTFTFQSKQTDAGEKLHTLFQAAAMSRKNKLSNVQKWWTKAHLYIHSVSSFVVIDSLRYCFTPQVLRDSFIGENSKTCMVRFDCEWSFRDLDQSP